MFHHVLDEQARAKALDKYVKGKADVLVATDLASSGLDFPRTRHVINYDIPDDIDIYVRRIGRTARGDHRGLSTTFVSSASSDIVLRDMKHVMLECKQKVPPFLLGIKDPFESYSNLHGCEYCGALGHRITECAKIKVLGKTKQKRMKETDGY